MQPFGAVTGYVDAAQVTLYAFWAFFACLIIYLRREDKREGYPLEDDRVLHTVDQAPMGTFPPIPAPKVFLKHDGTVALSPPQEPPSGIGNAVPVASWPGAPIHPLGDPMLAGVGPGSYALRPDTDAETPDHEPRIVPLRLEPERYLDPKSPDPRGLSVRGADGRTAGVVNDMWFDRDEDIIRYLEVGLTLPGVSRTVLVPMVMARIRANWRYVGVKAITAAQFADIPALRHNDRISFREEDRIVAYFGGGYLYATPGRVGPVL